MHMTRSPATVLMAAIVLAMPPVAAESQTIINNNITVTVAEPITLTVPPNLQFTNPTLTINPTAVATLVPGNIRNIPTLAPTVNPAIRPLGIAPSVNAAGLGRLVTPDRQQAGVVVGRIGSTAGTAIPNLTVDFEGDGLINFEIAPGIVDIPAETASPDGNALGGLVGQHITMATGTADRVLDSVINVSGLTPATTFEVANGTVILGGFQPQDVAGVIDIPIPDGPTSPDPRGDDGRDPGRQPQPQGDDHASQDPVGGGPKQPGEYCLSSGCYPYPSDPRPEAGLDLDDFFNFTGFRRPPAPDTAPSVGTEDFLDVSIMLPLRNREPEGDQFSNYGNEEIW